MEFTNFKSFQIMHFVFSSFFFYSSLPFFFPMKSSLNHVISNWAFFLHGGLARLVFLGPQCSWPFPWIRAPFRWLLLPETVFKRHQLPCKWGYSMGCSQRARQITFITKECTHQASFYLSHSRLWKVALVTDCGLHIHTVWTLTMNYVVLQVQFQVQ